MQQCRKIKNPVVSEWKKASRRGRRLEIGKAVSGTWFCRRLGSQRRGKEVLLLTQ
ncbi:hypothetical protein CLOLEP_02967 [[Clostridium] leptum DSM 753]|uniref:Uncharacterized protein n=1 Tax=[Clostridium] leptum DSM 753 TaxID=428125 RepID=A7VWK2_9FIRM|nr:hypothetical protein CLOLEP_02967 [[Clostridium] leptum DSM 753]